MKRRWKFHFFGGAKVEPIKCVLWSESKQVIDLVFLQCACMCVCAHVCMLCVRLHIFFPIGKATPLISRKKPSQLQISEAMGMLPEAVTPCIGWLVDVNSHLCIQTHTHFFRVFEQAQSHDLSLSALLHPAPLWLTPRWYHWVVWGVAGPGVQCSKK